AVVHGDGESPTAGPYQLSHRYGFARYLYLVAGLQSPFRVQYAANGATAEAQVTGLPSKAMRDVDRSRYPETPRAGNASWRLLENGSVGVLKVTSFGGKADDGTPLSAFFGRVFT